MIYTPAPDRYDRVEHRRSGRSGLLLPAISLGLWHNFGNDDKPSAARSSAVQLVAIRRQVVAETWGSPPALP